MAGKFYYDRKKKFQLSVWRVVLLCQFLVLAITTGKKKFYLAGCAVVSVSGSGDYDFVLVQLKLKLIQIR